MASAQGVGELYTEADKVLLVENPYIQMEAISERLRKSSYSHFHASTLNNRHFMF